MAVPKRKMSRSSTGSRRAQWKAEVPQHVPVRIDGADAVIPRRLFRAARRRLIEID